MNDESRFEDAFNAGIGRVRLVLLVSPTCAVCLAGVEEVKEALRALDADEVAVHVVWVSVLDDDSEAVAEERALSFATPAEHYWDGELVLSARFGEILGFDARNRKVAWDLYLLYDADAIVLGVPPAPTIWMHQLRIEDVPELDGAVLAAEIRKLASGNTASRH